MNYDILPWIKSDQRVFIADISKAKNDFHWQPAVKKEEGLKKMIEWVNNL